MKASSFKSLLGLLPFVIETTAQANDTLGLTSGFQNYSTSAFSAVFVNESQILVSLKANDQPGFDFLPFDNVTQRSANGQHHWGDISFHYRVKSGTQQNATWSFVDSAARREPIESIPTSNSSIFLEADLKPTLGKHVPLQVVRRWGKENEELSLSFTFRNPTSDSIELGSVGIATEVNNIFTGRTQAGVTEQCSLADPYIGQQAGYVQVTPVSGVGMPLLVTPVNGMSLEAWRFLSEPSVNEYQTAAYEGSYSWEAHTLAWIETTWNQSEPWNPPTSTVLSSGQSATFTLRFSLAQSIRDISNATQAAGFPTMVSVPGYVIPNDLEATVSLRHTVKISKISFEPVDAFNLTQSTQNFTTMMKLTPNPAVEGRVRMQIEYEDKTNQSVHYYRTKSWSQAVSNLGSWLSTSQWYDVENDFFNRSPSVLSYDYSVKNFVLQDPRTWIAGLSDEAGAGSFLTLAMVQISQPKQDQFSKIERMVSETFMGDLQPNISQGYDAVRKSLFYWNATGFQYDNSIDWVGENSWNKSAAYRIDRAYDYIHVGATYWTLYRSLRYNPSFGGVNTWEFYLNHSYSTIMFGLTNHTFDDEPMQYWSLGLMGETFVGHMLNDLQYEGFEDLYSSLKAAMRTRAQIWSTQAEPFASEQPWDSTGEEGVYYWSRIFNHTSTAQKTIQRIVGYMPTISHWGWHGNARRYWDFTTAGKLSRIERMIHHYGSSLNALPLAAEFRTTPDDIHLLRTAYGGLTGGLTSIHPDGFASLAFHSYPETLQWDPYSGDYGPNFVGITLGSTTFVVDDPVVGLTSYGGVLSNVNSTTKGVKPRDAIRQRVFIAPQGIDLAITAGAIDEVQYLVDGSEFSVSISSGLGSSALSWTILNLGETTGKYTTSQPPMSDVLSTTYNVTLNGNVTQITFSRQ